MTTDDIQCDFLQCPKSKSALVQEGEQLISVDPECRLVYKIVDRIPVMLIDEATTLSLEEWQSIMEKHERNFQTGERNDQ